MVKFVKTKILPCTCQHKFQDENYGQNNRVHNPCPGKSATEVIYRCTVCSKQISKTKETK